MKNISLLFMLLLPGTSVLWSQATNSFSLDQAIEYAAENHSEIRLEQLNVLDAEKQILEFKATGIPKLNASGSWNHFIDIPTQIVPDFTGGGGPVMPFQFGLNNNVTVGVDLSVLIFDGSFLVGLQAQKLFRDLTQRQVNVKRHELKNRVTQAYMAALIAEKNAGLLDQNIASLEEIVAETRATYEAGFAEKLDVDRLRLSLENLKTERQKVGRLLEVSHNLVKFQMGYPLDQPIELSDSFDEISQLEWTQEWVANDPIDPSKRPEYDVITLGEELNKANIKRLQASYLPVLRGFFSYSEVLQRNDLFQDEIPWFPTTVAGLSFSFPIFDGLQRTAMIQRARVDLDKTRVQKAQFFTGMELEVRNNRIQLQNAYETSLSRKRSLDLAEEIYETAQIKFREGVGSSLELAQAESDMITAQGNYIEALYDLVVAKADLDHALGNP